MAQSQQKLTGSVPSRRSHVVAMQIRGEHLLSLVSKGKMRHRQERILETKVGEQIQGKAGVLGRLRIDGGGRGRRSTKNRMLRQGHEKEGIQPHPDAAGEDVLILRAREETPDGAQHILGREGRRRVSARTLLGSLLQGVGQQFHEQVRLGIIRQHQRPVGSRVVRRGFRAGSVLTKVSLAGKEKGDRHPGLEALERQLSLSVGVETGSESPQSPPCRLDDGAQRPDGIELAQVGPCRRQRRQVQDGEQGGILQRVGIPRRRAVPRLGPQVVLRPIVPGAGRSAGRSDAAIGIATGSIHNTSVAIADDVVVRIAIAHGDEIENERHYRRLHQCVGRQRIPGRDRAGQILQRAQAPSGRLGVH
mmetsp:Transcript_18008/g.42551  ORF Transcript_18008/g.42551 Transcript_18008/m.42551 type:complete len:362 (-) Transcript_18008:983-2068(-)